MTYVRTPFILAVTLTCLVPDVAFARREPGLADAPAAAPQPVAPAAPAEGMQPVATAAAPDAAAPTGAPVAAAPAMAAPVPAPVVTPSMHRPFEPTTLVRSEKNAKGMIMTGALLLSMSYVFTSCAGAVAIDKGKKGRYDGATMTHVRDKERVAFGRSLLIPVVGPFLAIGHTDSAVKRWGATMSGLVQVSGAAILAVGLVAKARIRRQERIHWSAGATASGASFMIQGRF
jgi:hypothetical protein